MGGAAAEETANDLDALFESVEALARGRIRQAVRAVLGVVPAGAHAQDEPPAAQVVDGQRHAREQRRMAEGDRTDEWPEPHARRLGGGQRERYPALQRFALGDRERQEVIRQPERLEAEPLRRGDDAAPAIPGQARFRLDQHAKLHRRPCRPPPGSLLSSADSTRVDLDLEFAAAALPYLVWAEPSMARMAAEPIPLPASPHCR